MLPRERVLASLNHQKTDRVPLDFWATDEVWENLYTHFETRDEETILQKFNIDIRQFQPDYCGPEFKTFEDGSYIDCMGVHRKPQENDFCMYEEYASFPLAFAKTVEDLASYGNWPDINHFNFDTLSDKIGNAHKTHYIKIETGGLFELSWALRGYEQFMIDMVLEPDICLFIMGKLTDFYIEYVKRAIENTGDKIDMVYTYDDIASQRSLIMSPEMWHDIIEPSHQRLNAVIKRLGRTVMYHSCGSIYPMIPLLAKLPIDVLNPLQPLALGMDLEKIKSEFGDNLCFHGGMDIQFLLPKGNPQEIRETTEKTIDIMSRQGGYILSTAHYIQADTPVENIIALYEAASNYKL